MMKLSVVAAILFFLFPAVSFAASCSSLSGGTTNYWKMDGNSNDAVGTLNGTDVGVSYSTSYGIINQGVSGAGTGYITSNGPAYGVSGSINFWVKPTSADITGSSYIFDSTATDRYLAYINSGSTPAGNIGFYLNGTNISDGSNGNTVTAGVWNMVTLTWTGSAEVIYINGSQTNTYSIATTNGTPTTMYFLERYTAVSRLAGDLDEFGIWNCTLSSSQVTTLYNGGAGLQYPFPVVAKIYSIVTSWVTWLF